MAMGALLPLLLRSALCGEGVPEDEANPAAPLPDTPAGAKAETGIGERTPS
jgi:hypothetical protein